MTQLTPIYTAENSTPAFQLNWAVTLFWRKVPFTNDWLPSLIQVLEQDGIRILAHQFSKADRSQFVVSTRPEVRPVTIIERMKGRLQFLVRDQWPKAFYRNYDLHSIGSTQLNKVEADVSGQLLHHDPRTEVGDCGTEMNFRRGNSLRLVNLQWNDPEIVLSKPRFKAHGQFRCNIHFVCVHSHRWREQRFHKWEAVRDMLRKAAGVKGHLLSRLGLLPDHVHLVLGFDPDESPLEVALSYMNNIAFVYDMQPVLMPSCFIGTVGNYDLGAISSSAWLTTS